MTLNLPDPWVGGDLAEDLPDDPKALVRALNERMASIQRNFEALSSKVVSGAQDIPNDSLGIDKLTAGYYQAYPSATTSITSTNPASPTLLTGASKALGEAGAYIVWGAFDLEIITTGGGIVVANVQVNGVTVSAAPFGPTVCRAAIASTPLLVTTKAAGEVLRLAAYKSLAGGSISIYANGGVAALGPL